MWDLPGPGLEPVSPALAGGFLTTVPPEKAYIYNIYIIYILYIVYIIYILYILYIIYIIYTIYNIYIIYIYILFQILFPYRFYKILSRVPCAMQ